MRLGISFNCYYELDDDTQIILMKKNNLETTFLASESPLIDERIKKFKNENIYCENLHGPCSTATSNVNDMWRNSERSEEMFNRIMHGVETCGKYEVPTLVLHVTAGNAPPRPNERGYQRFFKIFERAKELGVEIACENIRTYGNLAFMLEQFPQSGFCWDTGHEAYTSRNIQFMPIFGEKLKALHIHDNMLDGDHHMIPGDGKIDFDRVARQIAESPYEGSIMLELSTKQSNFYNDVSPEDYYERAGKAAQKLKEKIESIRNNIK